MSSFVVKVLQGRKARVP